MMPGELYARKTFLGHIPINSWTHSLHPVTRLSAFICFSGIPLFISVPEINVLIIGTHLSLLLLAKIKASILKRFLPVLVTMAIFMTIVAIATASSSAPLQTALSCATDIRTQLIITFNSYVKIVAMFSATLFYFATNTEREFLVAFRQVGLPRVPAYVLGLSIRSAALFAGDLASIREAERGRGGDRLQLSSYRRVRKPFAYVVPLFAIGIRRIEEISDALFCRGFTLLRSRIMGARDTGYIAALYAFKLQDGLIIVSLVALLALILKLSLLDHALTLKGSPLANSWLCGRHALMR